MKKTAPKYLDRIIRCDCVDGMRRLPDGCIDMTLTSPPYGEIRTYGGQAFDFTKFRAVAEELFRLTKPGGVVVWVVREQAPRGKGETGDSSRQRLYFQEVGFRLHHTMVMDRIGCRWPGRNRYGHPLEYAIILSKGKPKTLQLLRDRPNRHAGKTQAFTKRRTDGFLEKAGGAKTVPAFGVRGAVWSYAVGRNVSTKDHYALKGHPALMPEKMALEHIVSWSRPGELILDPFCGAATTCKMALLNHRRHLGFEVHEPYYHLALRRMRDAQAEYRRRMDSWLVGA
ncbi:DNA-methyltransferase [Tautonia plasticadhaerens]|uniref:Methyltransferase n=1 Tax=Tautonia plasticadhaerens TaxID=2527974 RepID=A0A518H889_9BACT|nr:site-specific DNA-methyltransferase [Tautonia plasticadhaerens]QDV36976.1 DNA adenine methyltransferase YhdJ [Tautonia plasticadhaerens]